MIKPNVKTLVVDVDDTISTHIDRDYINAKPHTEMIQKLNMLFDQGWDVIYHTARGQVSCKGDIDLIEKTKRPVLEKWLEKNNVKYTSLLFGKPIGAFYIDDKALRPDEFLKTPFLKMNGGSGADIHRIGNRVIKKGSGLKKQVQWYELVKNKINVPEVYTFFDDTIDMEYVEGISLNNVCNKFHINKILDDSSLISQVPLSYKISDWHTMVNRIKDHLEHNAIPYEHEIMKKIDSEETHTFMNKYKSFMHGDFTLSNMILNHRNNIFYIDSNYDNMTYSSFLLDYGKLYQSLHHNYEETFMGSDKFNITHKYEMFCYLESKMMSCELVHYITLCELIHYIRMLKYKSDEDKLKVMNIIEMIYNDERLK